MGLGLMSPLPMFEDSHGLQCRLNNDNKVCHRTSRIESVDEPPISSSILGGAEVSCHDDQEQLRLHCGHPFGEY